jgi:uncharacterized protein (TIGR04145 family)
MKKNIVRTFLIFLCILLIPFPAFAVNEDYIPIHIDGYYDDWTDKAPTEVYPGNNPPSSKINYVKLFRDESKVYMYVEFAYKNNQDITNMIINLYTNMGDEDYFLVPDQWFDMDTTEPNLYAGYSKETLLAADNTNSQGSNTDTADTTVTNPVTDLNDVLDLLDPLEPGNLIDPEDTLNVFIPDTPVDSNTDSGADSGAGSATDSGAGSATDSGINTPTDSGINTTTDSGIDSNANSGIDSGFDSITVQEPQTGNLDVKKPGYYGTWSFTVWSGLHSVGSGFYTRTEGDPDHLELNIPLSSITHQYDGITEITMRIKKLGPQMIMCAGASTGPYIGVMIGAGIAILSAGAYYYKKKRPFTFGKESKSN